MHTVLAGLHKVGTRIQDLKLWQNVMQPAKLTVLRSRKPLLDPVIVQETKAALINLLVSRLTSNTVLEQFLQIG